MTKMGAIPNNYIQYRRDTNDIIEPHYEFCTRSTECSPICTPARVKIGMQDMFMKPTEGLVEP